MKATANSRTERRRIPSLVLLALALLLAAVVVFLTWPLQKLVSCESLPQLTALAVCAGVLFVFAARVLSAALAHAQDWRLPVAAMVLAGLSLFLAVHFIVVYRAPCQAIQHQLHPG